MAQKVFPNSATKLTGTLSAGSRRNRRARAAGVNLDAASCAPRRKRSSSEFEAGEAPALRRCKRQAPAAQGRNGACGGSRQVHRDVRGIANRRSSPPRARSSTGVVTVEAARLLGLQEIPCIVAGHLSPTEIRLLRLALNRLGEKGTWGLDALKLEFEELVESKSRSRSLGSQPLK